MFILYPCCPHTMADEVIIAKKNNNDFLSILFMYVKIQLLNIHFDEFGITFGLDICFNDEIKPVQVSAQKEI